MRLHNIKLILFMLVIGMLVSGCASKSATPPAPYQIRLSSVDELDSRAYDLLLLADEALNAASETVDEIPTTYRRKYIEVVNRVGTSYNLTRDAWKTYRSVILVARIAESEPDRDSIASLAFHLSNMMNALESAMLQLFSGGGD